MNSPTPSILLDSGNLTPIRDHSIGTILVDSGRLSPESAEKILRIQKEQDSRFGETALQLGLVTEDDIRFALARQFDYQYLTTGDRTLMPELIAAFQAHHPCVEALRALRSQIMLRWLDNDIERKAFTVVSAEDRAGRSFIAGNLAVLLSQLGENTLLIDADLRRPSQHQLFQLENRIGLSSILGERAGSEAIVRIDGFSRLSVLPAGPTPPNPQELLSRPGFSRLIDNLAHHFDVIVVDTPSCMSGADAQIISARTGAALLVTRTDQSKTASVNSFVEALNQSGVQVLGAVLNQY